MRGCSLVYRRDEMATTRVSAKPLCGVLVFFSIPIIDEQI